DVVERGVGVRRARRCGGGAAAASTGRGGDVAAGRRGRRDRRRPRRADPALSFTPCSHDRSRMVTKSRALQGNLTGMNAPRTTTSKHGGTRVDMHCHSAASQLSRLGVQRAAGLPECATPPEEVYELAKRRGMDFVTITDHDTIAGVLEISHRPDVFISEELTAWFR